MELFSSFKALSNRYSKLRNEFLETQTSLSKFTRYGKSEYSASPDRFKKHPVTPPQRRVPLHKTFNKQSDQSQTSESSEESLKDDDFSRKESSLQSAIVRKIDGSQSRREIITEQNSCLKLQSRNRRILGIVQSTLKTFQTEERKRQPQDLKRKKILEKIEAAEEEEKQLAKKQKMELIFKTKEQQSELWCLEKMMKIAESFELWERNQKYLLNFNLTKAEPQICFLPAIHTSKSKKHLEVSRIEIQEKMAEQKAAVEVSLARIREYYQSAIPINLDWLTSSGRLHQKMPVQKLDFYSNIVAEETFSSLGEDEFDFLHNMSY